MKKDEFQIEELDVIGANEAQKILEIKHKNQIQILTLRYGIPHLKLSFGRIFSRKNIEILRDSEIFQFNRAKRQGKNPRKISDETIHFDNSIDLEKLDLIGGKEAMEILKIKHKSQFYIMVERYEIPHKKIVRGSIFLRSDIEKVRDSARRTENLRRRHGK